MIGRNRLKYIDIYGVLFSGPTIGPIPGLR